MPIMAQAHYDEIEAQPPMFNVYRNYNGPGRHAFMADGGGDLYEITRDGKAWKAIAPDGFTLAGAKTMGAAKALAELDAHGRYHEKKFPGVVKS